MQHIFLLQSGLRYAATAFVLCYCAMWCRAADWPQPIVPPRVESPSTIKPITPSSPVLAPIISSKVESPGTIGTPSLSSLPGIVSGPNVAALQGADPHRAALPSLLEQMNTGRLLPQKAWDDKLINVDDLLWIFSSYIGPWGNLGAQKNVEVRRALVKLLLENGGAKLQPIEKQPPTVRLWIADYYQGLGDEKCIALCEGILAEIKAPAKGENALIFQAIERMGWFYRDKGQYENGVRAWLRIEQLCPDKGWWRPDSYVEAARLYLLKGDYKAAESLHQKVKPSDSWFFGVAVYDRTESVLREGNAAQARQFLEAAYAQLSAEPESDHKRQVDIPLRALWARLCWLGNEPEQARQHATKAVQGFAALPPAQATGNLRLHAARAATLLQATTPATIFSVQPKKIRIELPRALVLPEGLRNPPIANVPGLQALPIDKIVVPQPPARRVVTVFSSQPVELKAVVDAPFRVQLGEKWNPAGGEAFAREVIVEWDAGALKPAQTTQIRISSPQIPTQELTVSVSVGNAATPVPTQPTTAP